jgi:hypothetical protein
MVSEELTAAGAPLAPRDAGAGLPLPPSVTGKRLKMPDFQERNDFPDPRNALQVRRYNAPLAGLNSVTTSSTTMLVS